MRQGVLAVGIILLVIGGFFYFLGNGEKEDYKHLRYLSEEANYRYNLFQFIEMIGGIILFVGFVVSIAGAVSTKKIQREFVNASRADTQTRTKAITKNKCLSCGKKIEDEWITCPQCGKSLIEEKIYCPSCGVKIQEDWNTCPKCGKSIEKPMKKNNN